MSDAEHLIENAICAIEKYPYREALADFFGWKVNIDMAKRCGVSLSAVWEMAMYCTTTYKEDLMERYRREW